MIPHLFDGSKEVSLVQKGNMRAFLGAIVLCLSFSLFISPSTAGDMANIIVVKVPEIKKVLVNKKELDCMA